MKKKKIKYWLITLILRFKNFKSEDTVIICSEPRGGSTWLMELVLILTNSTCNWESLHVKNGVFPTELNLGWRPKLIGKNKNFKKIFIKSITLQSCNKWTLKYTGFKQVLRAKFVLSKFVRANQLLPWIVSNIDSLTYKPIYLLRHPIPTCISQLQNFENTTFEEMILPLDSEIIFSTPTCINNERFIEHESYINTLSTSLERQIALWCINNVSIVKHSSKEKWISMFYEDLVQNPKEEIQKLLSILKISYNTEILETLDFRKMSGSNFLGRLTQGQNYELDKYFILLDNDILKRIQSIFDYFDLKVYQAFNSMPKMDYEK